MDLGLDAARARAHDDDAAAEEDRLLDVVGDEQHGLALALPDAEQQFLHQRARLVVERAERLVEQQDLRDRWRARARSRCAAACRRRAAWDNGARSRTARPGRISRRRSAALRLGHAPLAQAEGDVLAHGQPGKQRVGLEHHAAVRARAGHRRVRRARTRPPVGRSSPATMRSSVDLPQPEGPRMVMKSLSPTPRSVGSSARVGAPPWRAGKGRETCSIVSDRSCEPPGKQPRG